MNAHTAEKDVLVRVVMNLDVNPYGDMFRTLAEQVATRVLASDWFVGVIADAKAEALREAAREWPTSSWWGEFDDWLRDRADRVTSPGVGA